MQMIGNLIFKCKCSQLSGANLKILTKCTKKISISNDVFYVLMKLMSIYFRIGTWHQ